MSSVLIKGMKLPKESDRRECSIAVVQNRPVSIAFSRTKTNLFECFECAEIPTPHGRLIDADELQTAIHGCLCETCETFPCEKGIGCLIEDVFNLIDQAPTIIEAEEE
jgi:hypothetical protein